MASEDSSFSQECDMLERKVERKLERVVEELMQRDMHQAPFAQGKVIPCDDYISLYQDIYTLLSQSRSAASAYGSKLYDKFKELVQKNVQSVLDIQDSTGQKVSNVGLAGKCLLMGKGEEGLETFLEKVKHFRQKMHGLSRVFAYMERYFIPRMGLPTLDDVVKTELSEQVLKKTIQQLKNELANLVDKRRDGKPVSEDLIREVMAFFSEMSPDTAGVTKREEENKGALEELETVFLWEMSPDTAGVTQREEENKGVLEELETFLLQRTGAYYKKIAAQWPQDSVEKAEQALSYEMDSAKMFLPEASLARYKQRLVKIIEDAMTVRLHNTDKRNDRKLGANLETSVKTASLNCAIHHKMQDPSKSTLGDAYRTANV